MGNAHASLVGGTEILRDLAYGGMFPYEEKARPGVDPGCVRYETADFYQARLSAAAAPIVELQKRMGRDTLLLPHGVPAATYYLWGDFTAFKNCRVPMWMREAAQRHDVTLPEAVEDANDLQTLVMNAWTFGLRPFSLAPGQLFTKDAHALRARLATVEGIDDARDAGRTLAFVGTALTGVDASWLGIQRQSVEALRASFPGRQLGHAETAGGEPRRAGSRTQV